MAIADLHDLAENLHKIDQEMSRPAVETKALGCCAGWLST
jgi:hypothetical protein